MKTTPMKRLFIFFVIVKIAFPVFGQNFLSEDKQWNVRNYFWGDIKTEIYWLKGDTAIDKTSYKKLWYSMDSLIENKYLQGFLREQDQKVFYRPLVGNEGLLYDFSLEVGDTVEIISLWCSDPTEKIVESIDTETYFGAERVRWHFNSDYEFWIEGIGSQSGLIHSFYADCVFDIGYDLLCYYENDELMYMRENEDECFQTSVGIKEIVKTKAIYVFPNPAYNRINIHSGGDLIGKSFQIVNINGVVLEKGVIKRKQTIIKVSNFPVGVYFIQFEDQEYYPLKFLIY